MLFLSVCVYNHCGMQKNLPHQILARPATQRRMLAHH